MLGATSIWKAAISRQRDRIAAPAGGVGSIHAFTELSPVSWTGNDEIVAVVVAGALGFVEGEPISDSGFR
jgi:hypothetical protein